MPKGRPPKPTEDHQSDGTLRPDRHQVVPNVVAGRVELKPSRGMSPQSRRAFRELVAAGGSVFDGADAPAVEAAAMVLAVLRESDRQLRGGVFTDVQRTSRDGDSWVSVEPKAAARLVLQAAAEFRQHAAVLGVGPVARVRIGADRVREVSPLDGFGEFDELAELRRQKQAAGE